jgi:hypothetical protein
MKPLLILAMDRASVRRTDAQGFLHVETSPITKEQVRVYMGREIPGWQELGLDASRRYSMYCPADELAKGAATANNLPLLSQHVPVDCDNIPDQYVVGSTGSVAAMDGAYLNNSLSVWKRNAIDGVRSNRKRELSGGYQYTPVMEPGEFQGVAFDGKMTDIRFNHVAIVFEGRAGPDVVIGDENMLKSRAALMASGALMGFIAPKLASGQTVALDVAMDGITADTFADEGKTKAFADKVVTLLDGKLAQDEAIDADGIVTLVGTLSFDAANDEIADKVAPKKGGKVTGPADMTVIENDDTVVAMDEAAINQRISDAVAAVEKRSADLRTAEREVSPVVGELSCDSAAGAYRMGLDHYGVAHKDLSDESVGATFRAIHAERGKKPVIVQDAAAVEHRTDFQKRFPNAVKLVRG